MATFWFILLLINQMPMEFDSLGKFFWFFIAMLFTLIADLMAIKGWVDV